MTMSASLVLAAFGYKNDKINQYIVYTFLTSDLLDGGLPLLFVAFFFSSIFFSISFSAVTC